MSTRSNRLTKAQTEAVLTSTHNLCFEQIYEKYQNFLSKNFQFLEVKCSIYLNRRVFLMFIYLFIYLFIQQDVSSILERRWNRNR